MLITSDKADATKHVFVGMWRPPFHKLVPPGVGTVIDTWGRCYPTVESVREAWLQGVFDTPLYKEPS